MRIVRTAIIAGAATLALAGAALAARDDGKLMLVALPDGSVQHIRYQTEAPPVLLIRDERPADLFEAAFGPGSPFAAMERISATMDAQAAMMRQAATIQAQAPATGQGVVLTNGSGQPVGVMHYSYVSSTTNADGCTRTVRISSDGSQQQPQVIRTSAGDCSAAKPSPAIAPAAPAASPITPAKVKPAAKPAPKIIPVKALKPLPEFTPSPTI